MAETVERLVDTPLVRELYFQFGVAAHAGQSLEKEICLLLYLPELGEQPQWDENVVDEIYESLNKKELGRLIHTLRKHFKIDPNFELLMENARKKRNYLIHHFFGDNAQRLLDESALPVLIKELKEIAILLQKAALTIRPYNEKLRESAQSAKAFNERQAHRVKQRQ